MKHSIVDRGELSDDYLDDSSALWIVAGGVLTYVVLLGLAWLLASVAYYACVGGGS